MTHNYYYQVSMVARRRFCQAASKLFFTLLLVLSLVEARPVLVMGCWFEPDSAADRGLQSLYRHSLEAIGYQLDWRYFPVARVQLELQQGLIDGDCARHDQYQLPLADGQMALRVPVVVGGTSINMWQSQDHDHRVSSLQEAEQQRLTILYERGTDIAKVHLPGYPSHWVYSVSDLCVGLRMLRAGRVDLFLAQESSMDNSQIGTQLCPEAQSLFTVFELQANPVLHARHQDIIAPWAEQLRLALANSGENK